MIITFPHMGNTYILAKAMLDDLGIDYVIPPFNSKRSLEIGTKLAPELACLPLKINLGNYIEAFEKGADTVLITGGCGPCRFGYYCEMSREILKDNGYNMDFITLDVPRGDYKRFFENINRLKGNTSLLNVLKIIKNTAMVSKKVDELESLSFKIRAREMKKGSTDIIYKSFQKNAIRAHGTAEILRLADETESQLLKVEVDKDKKPLRVGIVGEIYTTNDPYTNFHIESLLGNMGIEVDRAVTISSWVFEHILKSLLPFCRDNSYKEAAKPYLGTMIGGHAQETIGNTVTYAKKGYDGVIQIFPLSCMPEIVAESILPAVERDYNIPVLTLIIDEMTGEAGYLTRIEAFADLLNKRREMESVEKGFALSGN